MTDKKFDIMIDMKFLKKQLETQLDILNEWIDKLDKQ